LAAYHRPGNQGYRLAEFRGPPAPPVRGGIRVSSPIARNAAAYAAWAGANGLTSEELAPAVAAMPAIRPAAAGAAAAPPVAATPADPAVVERGRRIFASNCVACHTLDRDGAAAIGPNLWGVLGRPAGSAEGFSYSVALRGSGIVWSTESINHFIEAPSTLVPGTIMASTPVSSAEDRAALLAYLASRITGAGDVSKPPSQQDIPSQRE
jgi:cytochrome c